MGGKRELRMAGQCKKEAAVDTLYPILGLARMLCKVALQEESCVTPFSGLTPWRGPQLQSLWGVLSCYSVDFGGRGLATTSYSTPRKSAIGMPILGPEKRATLLKISVIVP